MDSYSCVVSVVQGRLQDIEPLTLHYSVFFMGVQLKIRRLVRATTGINAEKENSCLVVLKAVVRKQRHAWVSLVCAGMIFTSHFIHS